ncbi:golvesin C-terminal-like domain-containing protein [Saccharothrix deserti]|uniref:golvesin C-terminal-like domain-containing protein n=1 Tax=Saccharothrix deserti TaxID=2593674 RepID=UPI00131CFA83|nr:GDSL-type esterase/lipase family protein [Saccharothrix deserti]
MILALLPVTAAQAAPDQKTDKTAERAGSPAEVASAEPRTVPPDKRTEVLGKNWRESADVAWTTSGDADGFHLLAARAADGYAWRTVATLSEPGFDVDQWIGNACATGSGRRLVVVYAPRTFTNETDLFDRGGFTATVNLDSGAVTKLPVQSSLAYYNPGCGAGETAVITQDGVDSLGRTRLLEVDAAAGTLGAPVAVPGQLTSAVPTPGGIVAADSAGLVSVDRAGARRLLAPTSELPFHLKADADGGVVFLDREGDTAFVRRLAKAEKNAQVDTLAKGPLSELGLAASAAGRVFVTGKADEVKGLPRTVARLDVPKDSEMSTLGEVAVTSVLRAGNSDPRAAVQDLAAARPVRVEAKVTATGKQTAFTVDPAATPSPMSDTGRVRHPELTAATIGAAGSPDTPLDAEQTCAIARNDPNVQVYQPTARQVEWAVNYAVTNGLYIQREANWKHSGLPAWQPQQMFPPRALTGGGRVPSQVMLGILAQESNLWQAARFALPGVTANPLIGNFYGTDIYNTDPGDDWDIRWNEADCGYGVAQVTDGMRMAGRTKPGETALPANQQKAVAVDFATNIAAGLRILQEKWNQTRNAGMLVNDGDPQYLENWFFAIWAYNSGFNPQNPPSDSPWGVGWANNPVNPRYPANRASFLDISYADAANPERWPYQEKVLGWAGHPIESVESPGKLVHGYVASYWNGWREGIDPPQTGPSAEANRRAVKPPTTLFCEVLKNGCDTTRSELPNKPDDPNTPEDESTIGEPAGPCVHRDAQGYYDLKCWWHYPAQWKDDCAAKCGHEIIRFREPDVAYQPDGRSYPPNCRRDGLPDGALVVDDVTTSVPPHSTTQRPCGVQWTSEGSFSLAFGADSAGRYPSKADFHQLGAGFGGHFWFSHTNRADAVGAKLEVTGTWTLNRPLNGWARVLVHTPDHGAHTQQARYEVNRGGGSFDKNRYLPQGTEQNKWVSLGVYQFTGTPQVRLSNITEEGRGVNDVAWDAVAFQPLPAKPRHIVAVLGDSYTSGEGVGNYYRETDNNHGTPDWAACRRSRDAWARKTVLFGEEDNLGQLADEFNPRAELGFVACSGARTWSVLGTRVPTSWGNPAQYTAGEGQFREIAQVDSGVLDANTTLVGLTIGANDENMFGGAISNCIEHTACGSGSIAEFVEKYKTLIDNNKSGISATLRTIASRAPNADIVLMGYPKLFVEENACSGQLFSSIHAKALNDLAAHITLRQREAVEEQAALGRKVHYAAAIDHFTGHRICDSSAWLHGPRLGANGEGDYHEGDAPSPFCIPSVGGEDPCTSRESFHPNTPGASGYSLLFQHKLDSIEYQGS